MLGLSPPPSAGGRTHTSTASVAVLPQAEDVEVAIRDEDLRIDTYRCVTWALACVLAVKLGLIY